MTARAVPAWLDAANRRSPWPDVEVLVAGLGTAGFAAAEALLSVGARVVAVDERADEPLRARSAVLTGRGARVRLGAPAGGELPDTTGLVVTSPGWSLAAPIAVAARAAGVPLLGEVDLARRLADPDRPVDWLAVTGTDGKTTTVRMLAAILSAAGRRAAAVGNIGNPVVTAMVDPDPADVLAVELSSFQLAWSRGVHPDAAALLNIAPDHLDWHGSFAAYAAAKARVFRGTRLACVYNAEDARTARAAAAAPAAAGCRRVAFTTGPPEPGELGVLAGVLVDRAFGDPAGEPLVDVAALPSAAPHNVANAAAAAALARAYGVPAAAVAAGLSAVRLDPHRIQPVGTARGVAFVDDSKATNPHAALASLRAFDPVVWVAGGLAKGLAFDELVRAVAGRLRGVVLLGRDRAVVAAALARHAPDVPVIEVASGETEAMRDAVRAAAGLARAGDTVLLAPGCASMDMFESYAARGEAFAAAVRGLAEHA